MNRNQTDITTTHDDIINFWFSERVKKLWFASTPEFDREIRDTYEEVWNLARSQPMDAWEMTPSGSLALVILLDQFPLNMFRGEAKSFSTEQLAVEVASRAVKKQQDRQLDRDKVSFLYMPFMHSENLDHQETSVRLFTAAGLTGNIRFAKHHRDIVRRFQRFPHRNAILSRESTREELEYLQSDNAFLG